MRHSLAPFVIALTATATAIGTATGAAAQTLEAWYPLDETVARGCTDAAGNGHDGTYDGCTLALPGAKPGTNTSIRLDGSSDKVDIPDGPGFTGLVQELSALCWMNADDFVGVQRFFGNDGSWTWGLDSTELRFTTRTILDYDLPVNLSTGVWYHIGVVFDASFDVHFYVDGQHVGTVLGGQPAKPPFPDWHIGYKDPVNPEWFDGMLDDIQIYDGVLTDAQVLYLYNNPGKRLGGPVGTPYCGPANLNSTGGFASIAGAGNEDVTLNDLTLSATGMPPNEMGYFLCSQTSGFVVQPGLSQGNLCLAGKIGRFNAQVQSTGGAGEFSIGVDLTALPVWPNQPVLSGETWYFQAWFTDMNPGPTSNFTDGLSVTFL